MQYLDQAKDAFDEVTSLSPSLKDAIALGNYQASTRDGVIQTINEMCDALQLASDLVTKELSASIVEFNQIKFDKEEVLRGYFARLASRFSESSIWRMLHEGRVCSELHKLGDRFETPFSAEAVSGVSLWEHVKTFFARSNKMSNTLHGLIEGERDYVRDFSRFLDDLRNRAEQATGLPRGQDLLRQEGESLIQLMRQKRDVLRDKLEKIRRAADAAIATLH